MAWGEEVLFKVIQDRWTRDRPKLTWEQVIPADVIAWCGIDGTLTKDRRARKEATRRLDPATGEIRARVIRAFHEDVDDDRSCRSRRAQMTLSNGHICPNTVGSPFLVIYVLLQGVHECLGRHNILCNKRQKT